MKMMSFFFLFQYGISGPYWYAGGATIQIILFAILSIMLKTRAPGAKTFLQVRIYTRHRHDVLVQHFLKRSLWSFFFDLKGRFQSCIFTGYQGQIWQPHSHCLLRLCLFHQLDRNDVVDHRRYHCPQLLSEGILTGTYTRQSKGSQAP